MTFNITDIIRLILIEEIQWPDTTICSFLEEVNYSEWLVRLSCIELISIQPIMELEKVTYEISRVWAMIEVNVYFTELPNESKH